MTIVFQGHVRTMTAEGAAPGMLAVTLATPMDPANGQDLTVQVPKSEAEHWIPGRTVSFTIYTLPHGPGA